MHFSKARWIAKFIVCAGVLSLAGLPLAVSLLRSHTSAPAGSKRAALSYDPAPSRRQETLRGCLDIPWDMPVCVADNVCFEGSNIVSFYVAPLSGEQWPWSTDAPVDALTQSSLERAWEVFEARCCKPFSKYDFQSATSCLRLESHGFSCCRQQYHSAHIPRLQMGRSLNFSLEHAFVLDTAVEGFQFGHSLSKIFQYASLAMWSTKFAPTKSQCERPTFSVGLFSRIKGRPAPEGIAEWLEFVRAMPSARRAADGSPIRFTTLTHELRRAGELHSISSSNCFRRVYFVHDYEQYLFRHADAIQLNRQADSVYDLPKCPSVNGIESAWRKGAIMLRNEGTSLRRFINKDQVLDVVDRVFGLQLDERVINSSMTAQQQLTPFREHGLILSAHSSQLKNLAFACPCSIVIEINAETNSNRKPFSSGLQHRNIVYVHSINHTAEDYGVYSTLRADVVVDLLRLEDDLHRSIRRHRRDGCHVF